MKKYLLILKKNWWIVFLAIFSLLSLAAEIYSGRWSMLDFEVYYRTAQRMLRGDEIYRIVSDGFYVYKYAPSAAILFMPFTILPIWIAKIVYWFGLTYLIGFVLQKLYEQIVKEQLNKTQLFKNAIFFALLTVLIHVHSELTIGQVNILLLASYVFLIFALNKNKDVLAALLLAGSLFIKPFGLIFLPYLILKKKYRLLLYFLGISLLIITLPILFYPSFDSFISLYLAWFNELSIELGNKQELFAKANHTIFSVLARNTPLKLILTSVVSQKIYQIIVIVGIGWLLYRLERSKQSILLEMSILIILIPLLAATSKNAFIFAMPLALFLFSYFKENSKFVNILTILGCAFIGGNLYDIYGHDFSRFLTEISIYSMGSILLIVAAFIYSKKSYTEKSKLPS